MAKDSFSISLDPREVTGKEVKHLRTAGVIPAVIHDHGKPSIHVQGDQVLLTKVWKQAGKHQTVNIKSANIDYVALIKDAAFDPKKHMLQHLVFNAVDINQQVEAEIPIHPAYAEGDESSPAEQTGLIVLAQLETVQVKSIPSALPDFLAYDATKLVEVGDHVTVADLKIPEGVEVVTEPEHALATVFEPSALAAANDAAGGDAEAGDEANVASDTAENTDAGQQPENMPGGKDQKEPKPSSVEATKAEEH